MNFPNASVALDAEVDVALLAIFPHPDNKISRLCRVFVCGPRWSVLTFRVKPGLRLACILCPGREWWWTTYRSVRD